MRSTLLIGIVAAGGLTGTALAQAGGRSAAPPAPAAEVLAVKNIEKQLENPVTIDAQKTTLGEFVGSLRKITQTNITVNWNALTAAGLSRDTPLTLHLKDVSFEHVVKTLIDVLPVKDGDPSLRLNYAVSDNTLSITTNAEMGKGVLPRIFPFARPMLLEGGAAVDEKLLETVVRAELVRAGEPMTAKDHALAARGETLVAAVSERGHMLINKMQAAFAAPTRPGQMPAGIAQTATARRGQEALAKAAGGPARITPDLFLALAREPRKYPGVNVAAIAGTDEELAKPAPDIAGTVNDGGVVLVGPRQALAARTVFAAYDLRDVLRRQAGPARGPRGAAPTPGAELMTKVTDALKSKVKADWGPLDAGGKTPTALVPYGTMLIVFAPADVQRQVTVALAELGR